MAYNSKNEGTTIKYDGDIPVQPASIDADGTVEFEPLGNPGITFVSTKEIDAGFTYTGTFVESYTNEKSKYPESPNHKFSNPDGTFTVVNGSGLLNKIMSGATSGDLLKLEYRGMDDKGHKWAVGRAKK